MPRPPLCHAFSAIRVRLLLLLTTTLRYTHFTRKFDRKTRWVNSR